MNEKQDQQKKHFLIKYFTSSTVLKQVMGIRLFQENGSLSISPENLIQ